MPAKILAVDDNHPRLTETLEALQAFGHEVRGLTDPREVSALVRSFRPDVCLLAVELPFISGADLLDSIRGIDPYAEVILLTDFDDTVVAVDMMRRGAADYLLEPVEPEKVGIDDIT